MSLPGTPHLQRRDGALQLDGVDLDSLARRFGTPLYVYSQQSMLDAVGAYQRALTGRPQSGHPQNRRQARAPGR